MLELRFCARAFSSCGKQGPLFIAVRRPLTIAASLVAEHRLQMHRLSNCGSRAQLLRSMWDLPRPGLEPVSPALAGRVSTTVPPGKPHLFLVLNKFILWKQTSPSFIPISFYKYTLLQHLFFNVIPTPVGAPSPLHPPDFCPPSGPQLRRHPELCEIRQLGMASTSLRAPFLCVSSCDEPQKRFS